MKTHTSVQERILILWLHFKQFLFFGILFQILSFPRNVVKSQSLFCVCCFQKSQINFITHRLILHSKLRKIVPSRSVRKKGWLEHMDDKTKELEGHKVKSQKAMGLCWMSLLKAYVDLEFRISYTAIEGCFVWPHCLTWKMHFYFLYMSGLMMMHLCPTET